MTDTSGNNDRGIDFLQWALPRMGYRWDGFSKPRGQVLKRIRERMSELKLSGGYKEYKDYLIEHHEEWENLDDLCNVTISKFFRDRKLWDFLRDVIMTELVRNIAEESKSITEPVLIWSAGCCNGEEPYSVAIIYEQLKDSEQQFECKPVSILATDRNEEVLQRAKKGFYPGGALKELKDEEISTFFQLQKSENNKDSEADAENESEYYKIKKRLKQNISFEKRDIRTSIPERIFDLVFCRNLVFTYFTEERQQRFLQRLKPHFKAGCNLVIGSNEQIPEVDWLEPVTESHPVYKKVVY